MADLKRNCDLCNLQQASVHCPCDAAYLCRNCDRKVHSANFLVARHLRSTLCSICGNLDGNRFSGAGISSPAARNDIICSSCLPENGVIDSVSDSSSESCLSSTSEAGEEAASSSSTTVSVDAKVEGVLVNWCRKMAVDERRKRQVVSTAMDCLSKMTISPFQVALTTSFWSALKICSCDSTCRDLKRLEEISGVPAKLVMATESHLARGLKRRRSRENHVEGWAEC